MNTTYKPSNRSTSKNKSRAQRGKMTYRKRLMQSRFRMIYALIFVAVFVWAGYQIFFSKAESPLPTDANAIVAQYDNLASYVATRQPDGTTSNILPPGEVIVAGDGTLYCNTSGNGVVTQGQLGPGELKQFFDDVNSSDVKSLADSQHAQPPDFANADLSTAATVVVNANAGAQIVSSVGDTTGTFSKVAAKVQKKCKDKNPTAAVQALPAFEALNIPGQPDGVARGFQLWAPAYAVTSATYNDSQKIGISNETNYYRSAHALPYLTYNTCLQQFTANTHYYGARPWSRSMALVGVISHNPNLSYIVTHCSGNRWLSYGENVGVGPDYTSVFKGFTNSCPHLLNILDPKYKTYNLSGTLCSTSTVEHYNRFGVGVSIDSKYNEAWVVSDFGTW